MSKAMVIRDDAFKTKQEIDDYLRGDRIQCLLCGKWYVKLAPHLKSAHDTTVTEYRHKYGIPATRGLCASDFAERIGEITGERQRADPEKVRADLERARAEAYTSGDPVVKPLYFKIDRTKYNDEFWRAVGDRVIAGEYITNAVQNEGMVAAHTGVEALKRARRRSPDLDKWWSSEVEPKQRHGVASKKARGLR